MAGTEAEFDPALDALEISRLVLLSKRARADLQLWRDQCGWSARGRSLSAFAIIDGAGIIALYLLVLYWTLDDLLK